MTLAKKLPVRSTLRSNRHRRSMFRIGETPQRRSGNAPNGIVAKLYHFMRHSREARQGKSVIVPVPSTTTPEAFRNHIVNWMRNRKSFLVSTHVISEYEISVWMRKEKPPVAPSVPPPWHMDEPEPLVKRKNARKRKQYRPRAGVPTESMAFDPETADAALGFAPLWPAGDAAAD